MYGAREVRVVRVSARRGVPARATAFGAAPVPRGPRARAGARSDRTLATRAAPKCPPSRRPQSATEAACCAWPHPSSPAPRSPLRRRVRTALPTAAATKAYRERHTRRVTQTHGVTSNRAANRAPAKHLRSVRHTSEHRLDADADALEPRALRLARIAQPHSGGLEVRVILACRRSVSEQAVAARGVQPPVAGERWRHSPHRCRPHGRLGRGRAASAATVAGVGSADSVRIRETPGLAMGTIDLQPASRDSEPSSRSIGSRPRSQTSAFVGTRLGTRAERRARAGGRTRHGGGAWPSSATIGPTTS
jgi:hypothetical protein